MRRIACIVPVMVIVWPLATAFGQYADRPLVIQWGQTTPDTRLMRKHVAHWEAYLPFDGVVIPINQKRYAGRYGMTAKNLLPLEHWPVTFTAFGATRAKLDDYQHAIDDLKATEFRKFKHNFIPLMTYPRMHFALDWFDDAHWETLLHNVGVLAAIAKAGGCKGIWFDTEQYGPKRVWNYTSLREIFPKRAQDFATYQAKAVVRGEQFIRAVNAEFPGIEIILAFGSCIIHADVNEYPPAKGKHFSNARCSLLAPFIDGMMRAKDKATKITDGYELSYYYKTAEQFAVAGPIVREACKAFSLDPDLYAKNIGLGFGLYPTHHGMFNPRDFAGNKFSPEDLAGALSLAMQHTDRYVWVWNEAASFWIKGGPDAKPLLPDQPGVDSESADLSHMTAKPTADNAMQHKRYYGVPTEYIDAIAKGKALGLKARPKSARK